jgi:hypothetical protein
VRFSPLKIALVAVATAGAALAAPAAASASDNPKAKAQAVGTEIVWLDANDVTVGIRNPGILGVVAEVASENPGSTVAGAGVAPNNPDCPYNTWGVLESDGFGRFGTSFAIWPSALTNACAGSLRVAVAATDHRAGRSAEATVQTLLRRRGSIIHTNASPEPVRKGATVTVTGHLERANWQDLKYHGYANHDVDLQFRTPTGSYETVKTVTSSSAGHLRTTVRQNSAGCWRWAFAGTRTTSPFTGGGDCVKLK